MKAVVYTRYGGPEVLKPTETAMPAPGPGEALVQVHAAAANTLDWRMMRATPFLARLENGLFRPRITVLGADVAGHVVAVGPQTTRFSPGDAVFGSNFGHGLGGFAEYIRMKESLLAPKPAHVSFAQAAALPTAGLTALQGLRTHGQLQKGQRVLINGASGGVGTFAVQIAKALGAEVTAVCSARNHAMARSIGADHVVDYTQQDFTRSGPQYDLIFCAVGNRSLADYRRALKPQGTCVIAGFTSMRRMLEHTILGPLTSGAGRQRVRHAGTVQQNGDDLAFLQELLQTRQITPVIDRCYPLSDTADAVRYLETGRAQGKVIIAMPDAQTQHPIRPS